MARAARLRPRELDRPARCAARPPTESAHTVAVAQIDRLLRRLPAAGPVPLFVFDAGYAAAQLQQGLGDRRAAIPVRLRSGRCCYADPPPPPATGRPDRHGRECDGNDPASWPAPSAEHTGEDAQYGEVRVRA